MESSTLKLSLYPSRRNDFSYWGSLLAAAPLLAGSAWLILSAFPSAALPPWAGLLIGLLLTALLLLPGVRQRKSRLRPAGLLLLLLLLIVPPLRRGLLALGNDVLAFITEKNARIHLRFDVRGTAGGAALLLWLLWCSAVAAAVESRRLLPLLPGLLLTALGCAAGFFSGGWPLLLLSGGLLLLLCSRSGEPLSPAALLSLLLIAGLLAPLLWLPGQRLPLPEAGELTAAAEKALHPLLYHSRSCSMPEGNLRNLGAWKKSDAEALRLSMEKPEKLYLRGWIGEVYTGTSWEAPKPEDLAPYEDLFYWLHQENFYPEAILSAAWEAAGQGERLSLDIETLQACRGHAYLPYAFGSPELLDPRSIGDSGIRPGERSLHMEYYSGSVPDWYGLQQSLAAVQRQPKTARYLAAEEAYRGFVYEQELQLTDSARAALSRVFPEDGSPRTLAAVKSLVLDALELNLGYREDTVVRNGSNDFLSYILSQDCGGYSVHYATAATLMLRYLGVPARYAEGYFLPAEEAEALRGGEPFVLRESHAHAWTEYYLDGVGWIPFEVTPGYIDDEELSLDLAAAESEKTYEPQSYEPDPPPLPPQELQGLRTLLEGRVLWILSLSLVLLVLLGLLLWVLLRRRRLRRTLERIRQSAPREAVAGLYGYGQRLRQYGAEAPEETEERAAALNREAVFSLHEMSGEQQNDMEAYVEVLRRSLRTRSSPGQRFRRRWLQSLYW